MSPDLAWLHWWSHAWSQAHADWTPAALARVPPARLAALARGHHVALNRAYGIVPCAAPRPRAALSEWLTAAAPRRALTLQLLATLCAPHTEHGLNRAQQAWCLSIAKAIRPGQWLGPGEDPLQLLRAWAGSPTWQRLRLIFPRAAIVALEQRPAPSPPPSKLDALWHAVLWRSAQDEQAGHDPAEAHSDAHATLA